MKKFTKFSKDLTLRLLESNRHIKVVVLDADIPDLPVDILSVIHKKGIEMIMVSRHEEVRKPTEKAGHKFLKKPPAKKQKHGR